MSQFTGRLMLQMVDFDRNFRALLMFRLAAGGARLSVLLLAA